jgi:DNA polymerase III delta prime subunit
MIGPPGCGKSSYVADEITNNDLAICMTTKAVNALGDKLKIRHKYKVKVFSLEKAWRSDLSRFKRIFVDEANMIEWMLLIPVIHEKMELLILTGDTMQVDVVDFFKIAGDREDKISLLDVKI